jgi:hypothetical protein
MGNPVPKTRQVITEDIRKLRNHGRKGRRNGMATTYERRQRR